MPKAPTPSEGCERKPTAKELDRVALVACWAYLDWLRDPNGLHDDAHDEAMTRLIGVVEERTGKRL